MTDEEMRAMRPPELGPTGEYPDGKLMEHDEGELQVGVTDLDGKVIVAFGKPVTWLGMLPDQAGAIANAILKRADAVEKGE